MIQRPSRPSMVLRLASVPGALAEVLIFVLLMPAILILALYDTLRRPRHTQPLLEETPHRA